MKKIFFKDVANLYIGCPIIIYEPGAMPESARLEGFDMVGGQAISERVSYPIEWIKPVLSDLADITEEQTLALCKEYSSQHFGDYRYSKWIIKRWKKWDQYSKVLIVTNKNSNCSFNIDLLHASIDLYEKREPNIVDVNPKYWMFFLKYYFDVFDLIRDGEAISLSVLQEMHGT